MKRCAVYLQTGITGGSEETKKQLGTWTGCFPSEDLKTYLNTTVEGLHKVSRRLMNICSLIAENVAI